MNQSKAKVVISTLVGKICSVLGYTLVIFFVLGSLLGANKDVGSYVVTILFIALGIWLIVTGIKTKRRIKRFKTYVSLISVEHITSLENIAASTSQSVDFVRNDLEKMIDKRFFANAHIDKKTNEIIIGSSYPQSSAPPILQPDRSNTAENESVKCSGCGAVNMKHNGSVINCEYCGSPIK